MVRSLDIRKPRRGTPFRAPSPPHYRPTNEAEVQLRSAPVCLGQGIGYLIPRRDRLRFQSPISWYVPQQKVGLGLPGYAQMKRPLRPAVASKVGLVLANGETGRGWRARIKSVSANDRTGPRRIGCER